MRWLLLCLLLVGCGWLPRQRHESHRTHSDVSLLRDTAEEYKILLPTIQDADGFVYTDHCDSVLFSGLVGAAGVPVKLTAAEDPDKFGRWYRRPTAYPECWATGNSRSTISRDMLLGVVWWAWSNDDLLTLERLWDYGESRSWFMGDDDVGGFHTVLNPTMIRLLAQSIYVLGGDNHEWARLLPYDWSGDKTDFEAHLKVLQILLAGELEGGIDDDALGALAAQATRQPSNPLFQAAYHKYTDGNYDSAASLLLNPAHWPADRLPTSAEHCSYWPTERDDGSDWQPCPADAHTHSGGELLFILRVIDGRA